MIERLFKLKENGTNLRTEVVAGFTTFMTMAYIIIVNPIILGGAGMDKGAVMTATIISAAFATLLMAVYANYPFALAPGMGLNAFFAVVVATMGLSWQAALAAVFINGIIFIVLTLTRAREVVVNAIPTPIKAATSAGIGLFIAIIGFNLGGIVVDGEPKGLLVMLGDFTNPGVLLTAAGLVITGWLVAKRVRGSLLLGILLTSAIGMVAGIVNPPAGIVSTPPSLAPTLFQLDFGGLFSAGTLTLITIIFTFTFVDMFDTIGTLIGVATKADMLDQRGELPRARQALFADAAGTAVGALLGTSTVTTYVESSAGVAEGGRTGLTGVVVSLLFLVALFFSPIVTAIPAQATAPALIIVGLFMMEPVTKINFSDFTEAIPAFLTIVMMPFTWSIAEGLVFGILSYVFLKVLVGKARDVSLTMWVLAVLFVVRFFFI